MHHKIKSLSDIDKIPSVLSVEELNEYLVELMEFIEENVSLDPLLAAEAINDLIGHQGNNFDGLSISVSIRILDWTKSIYDSFNMDLVECCSANIANLTCMEAKEYLIELIHKSHNDKEKCELEESLGEIEIKK